MNNSGYEKAKEVANGLKPQEVDEAINETDGIAVSKQEEKSLSLPETYFEENKNVGLEEVTQEDMPTPTLQIIQKMSKVVDDDGRPFVPGVFYYKATRKVYEEIEVSILTFTKGEFPTYTNKDQLETVYIFMGALTNGEDMMPFKMFLRGFGAGAARQFLGEVTALKKPMYALRVKVSSVKRENDKGEFYVAQFKILGLRSNPEEIVVLENLAKTYSQNRSKVKEEAKEEAKAYSKDMPF